MVIKPTDKSIKELLETSFYRIPRFQRPYSWDPENVEEFWNDAVTSEDQDYFIGSFVLYASKAHPDTLFVVDGQQRLTTITLLLAAVRDSLAALGEKELAKGVHTLIERPDINNENQYVLQSETPYPYLQEHIQKFGAAELPETPGQEEETLKTAYLFLRQQIDRMLDSVDLDTTIPAKKKTETKKVRLIGVRNKLLRLQLISVVLDNEDDAYLIFETLNTRGKDLTVADLVKNLMTRLLKPTNKGVDVAKEKWLSILELFDSSEADIDVNRFLHHAWLSRQPYTTEKKLFKEIKRTVDKADAKNFLNSLVADAKLYRRIFEPSSHKWKLEERPLLDAIHALNIFRVVQPVAMVLSLLRAYEADGITLKQCRRVLQAMENFHVQFTAVTSQRTGGGTAFMYAYSARALTNSEDKNAAEACLKEFMAKLRDRVPTYEEFEAGFQALQFSEEATKQRGVVHYILSRIDRHFRQGDVVDYSAMTIEHLAAQNPEGLPEISADLVGQMGNLILVPEKLNGKLGNKPMQKKQQLLTDAGVPLDKDIKQAAEWSEQQIKARTKALAKLAYETIFKV